MKRIRLTFLAGGLALMFGGNSGTVDGTALSSFMPGDIDRDALLTDNCPSVYNPEQFDFDLDGVGDACDLTTFKITNAASDELAIAVPAGMPTRKVTVARISNRTGGSFTASVSTSSGTFSIPNGTVTVPAGTDRAIVLEFTTGGKSPGVYDDTVTVTVGGQTYTTDLVLNVLANPARQSSKSTSATACQFVAFFERVELVGTIQDGGPDYELQLHDSVTVGTTPGEVWWPDTELGLYVLSRQGTVEPGLPLVAGTVSPGSSPTVFVETEVGDYDTDGRGFLGTDNLTGNFTCNSSSAWQTADFETYVVEGSAEFFVTTRIMYR